MNAEPIASARDVSTPAIGTTPFASSRAASTDTCPGNARKSRITSSSVAATRVGAPKSSPVIRCGNFTSTSIVITSV